MGLRLGTTCIDAARLDGRRENTSSGSSAEGDMSSSAPERSKRVILAPLHSRAVPRGSSSMAVNCRGDTPFKRNINEL